MLGRFTGAAVPIRFAVAPPPDPLASPEPQVSVGEDRYSRAIAAPPPAFPEPAAQEMPVDVDHPEVAATRKLFPLRSLRHQAPE